VGAVTGRKSSPERQVKFPLGNNYVRAMTPIEVFRGIRSKEEMQDAAVIDNEAENVWSTASCIGMRL
jgi:hypothetical protein